MNKVVRVFQGYSDERIESLIKDPLNPKAIVFSDKITSYFYIENYVEAHLQEKSTKQTTFVMLKWVHIAISNVKRNSLGVYHKIIGEHLQK